MFSFLFPSVKANDEQYFVSSLQDYLWVDTCCRVGNKNTLEQEILVEL